MLKLNKYEKIILYMNDHGLKLYEYDGQLRDIYFFYKMNRQFKKQAEKFRDLAVYYEDHREHDVIKKNKKDEVKYTFSIDNKFGFVDEWEFIIKLS